MYLIDLHYLKFKSLYVLDPPPLPQVQVPLREKILQARMIRINLKPNSR